MYHENRLPDSAPATYQSLGQSLYDSSVQQGTGKRQREIVLTADQAKQKKLQKGYVLEPVISTQSDSSLPEKRERKKSSHFGYSPPQDLASRPAPSAGSAPPKPVHKTKHHHHHHHHHKSSSGLSAVSNGNVRSTPPPVAAAPPPPVQWVPKSAVAAPALSQWAEKKAALQARLRRIDARLALVREQNAAQIASVAPAASDAPAAFGDVSRVEAHPHFHPGPPKRKASEMSLLRMTDSTKRVKPADNGSAGGEMRLLPAGKMRRAFMNCESVLDLLMRDPASRAYFNVPVDSVALGIPEYPQIIKNPMDLGTVKMRLESGFYSSVEEWEADVKLVWSNAMLFNMPNNDVHECAKKLAGSFEKMMSKFHNNVGWTSASTRAPSLAAGMPLAASASAAVGAGSGRQVLDLKRSMEKLQQELASLKSGKGVVSSGGGPITAAAPAVRKKSGGGGGKKRTMSFDEKRDLALYIKKLNEDQLVKVVEIVSSCKGNKLDDAEEVEIDVDTLDPRTLRELNKYVTLCLKPKPPPKGARRGSGGGAGAGASASNAALLSAAQRMLGVTGGKGPSSDSDSDSESDSSDSDYAEEGKLSTGGGGGSRPPQAPSAAAAAAVAAAGNRPHHGASAPSGGSNSPGQGRHSHLHAQPQSAAVAVAAARPQPTRPQPAASSAATSIAASAAAAIAARPAPVPSAAAALVSRQPTAPTHSNTLAPPARALERSPPPQAIVPMAAVPMAAMPASMVQEPSTRPQILPLNAERRPLEVANSDAWASLSAAADEEAQGSTGPVAGAGAQLWSQYQKDLLVKQRLEEKRREEERERDRREQERRATGSAITVPSTAAVALASEVPPAAEAAASGRGPKPEEEEGDRRALEARREEERAKLAQMQQTVNMDQDRILSKNIATSRYMGLEGVGGLNLANLRAASDSDSDGSNSDGD